MPELPEVEHIRRGLSAFLPGRRIEDVEVRWPGTIASHTATEFATAVRDLAFGAVGRRGKYLVLSLAPYELVIHLRMTGRILASHVHLAEWEEHPHVRVIFRLDRGASLYLSDVRKFARIYLVSDASEILGTLGMEPLAEELSLEVFGELLASHRRQLKPLLLDQHLLAGLGNIYTDETLWLAGLHPRRRSDTLGPEEIERLHQAMRATLQCALADGGTTMRDYRDVEGHEGTHQHSLAVYGRQGLPCPRCGAPVMRITVGQRGTHLCPVCQLEPAVEDTEHVPA